MASNGESPVPDEGVVIRGGTATREKLRSSLRYSVQTYGVLELSVFSFADLDAEGIARRVRADNPEQTVLPQAKMQESTCGEIRRIVRASRARFLLTEPPPGHHSIMFDALPADEVLDELVAAFGGEDQWICNPVRRGAS